MFGDTFRLAHLTDIHLGPLPQFRKRDLVSKRITGYINWRRKRAKAMGNAALAAIVDDIHAQAPDHIAVSGDLMNLSLAGELAAGRLWMEALGEPADVSFVPGNHDAYVFGALGKTVSALRAFCSGDNDTPVKPDFPYMRVRGPLALIGVNSARATPAFVSAGHVSERQMAALEVMLIEAGRSGHCRVVVLHHPPVRGAATPAQRLYGIRRFQQAIERAGAELVLHGHTHTPSLYRIKGPDGRLVPVVGAAAAGQMPGGHRPPANWNAFSICKTEQGWSITLVRRHVSGSGLLVQPEDGIEIGAGQATAPDTQR
jgi:3',5'-cyclic AMP phosphodiesterase CpdA